MADVCGLLGTGVAPAADPPVEWSETTNVKWKVEIAGRGSSSPDIWGDRDRSRDEPAAQLRPGNWHRPLGNDRPHDESDPITCRSKGWCSRRAGFAVTVATADNSPDAVILCTDSAEIRMVNSAAARLTGYATRELQTLTVWDITHSASQGDFDVLWKEFLRAGRQRGTYLLRTRQGDAIHVAYCAEVRTFGDLHLALLHPPDGQTQP